MKIYKKDIKKIIDILESKYSELKDDEYFELKGDNLVKSVKFPEYWFIYNHRDEAGKIFDEILTGDCYQSGYTGFKLYSHNIRGVPLSEPAKSGRSFTSGYKKEDIEYKEITLEQLKQYQLSLLNKWE